MQLNPGENFVITHQIGDHTDSTTYYVQSVVRNALTDAIIDTVNLTDRGNRRFSKAWQVPQDPSGQGFYISITSTVYTDSGYTSKSAVYSEVQERLLVQVRTNAVTGGGGGGGGGFGGAGGADIDYKKIRKIIQEELDKIDIPEAKEIEWPKIPELDLSSVTSDIVALKADINAVLAAIGSLPRFEKTEVDLSGVISGIENVTELFDELKDHVENMKKEVGDKLLDGFTKQVTKTVEDGVKNVMESVEELAEKISEIDGNTVSIDVSKLSDIKKMKNEPKEEVKEEYKPDIEGITRRMKIRKATKK